MLIFTKEITPLSPSPKFRHLLKPRHKKHHPLLRYRQTPLPNQHQRHLPTLHRLPRQIPTIQRHGHVRTSTHHT